MKLQLGHGQTQGLARTIQRAALGLAAVRQLAIGLIKALQQILRSVVEQTLKTLQVTQRDEQGIL